jgi:hypothetical protein
MPSASFERERPVDVLSTCLCSLTLVLGGRRLCHRQETPDESISIASESNVTDWHSGQMVAERQAAEDDAAMHRGDFRYSPRVLNCSVNCSGTDVTHIGSSSRRSLAG